MKTDRSLVMLAHGEATWWERLVCLTLFALSSSVRLRYRRILAVRAALRNCLADEDELVHIEIPIKRNVPARSGGWVLLGILVLVAFLQWRHNTLPVLAEWARFVARKCGLG